MIRGSSKTQSAEGREIKRQETGSGSKKATAEEGKKEREKKEVAITANVKRINK